MRFPFFVFLVLTLIDNRTGVVTQATLYLIVFNVLILALVIPFLITTFKDPGDPTQYRFIISRGPDEAPGFRGNHERITPNDNHPSSSIGTFSRPLFILPQDDNNNGGNRYCDICMIIKPPRCHHCSSCNRCILKMDHHCPWFNACVGYQTYKFFILTAIYGLFFCAWTFGTLLGELIYELVIKTAAAGNSIGISVQFIIIDAIALIMGISCGMLLGYHVFILLGQNQSTIEWLDRRDRKEELRLARVNFESPTIQRILHNPYDLGWYKNVQQVMGRNVFFWFLPIANDECMHGLMFPRNDSNAINTHMAEG